MGCACASVMRARICRRIYTRAPCRGAFLFFHERFPREGNRQPRSSKDTFQSGFSFGFGSSKSYQTDNPTTRSNDDERRARRARRKRNRAIRAIRHRWQCFSREREREREREEFQASERRKPPSQLSHRGLGRRNDGRPSFPEKR